MFTKKIPPLIVLAVFALSACGGGGGTNASSASATMPSSPSGPSASTASSLQTSVANPTYAASSAQLTAFSQLNAYRLQMGVGELEQDTTLDTAAQAHATYLNANFSTGALTALTHDEVATLLNYYDDTPLDRAQKAGAPVTEWIGESIGDSTQATATAAGSDCVTELLDTVYHMEAMTDTEQIIGIGFAPISAQVGFNVCNFVFGSTSGVSGTPQANAIPVTGGQQMATTAIVTVPLSGETGVALSMVAESPNPVPSITSPGRPLMVRVNAASAGDVLTVSSFTLTDAKGNAVPGEIMIPAGAAAGSTSSAVTDPNGIVGQGVAFFIPSQPLVADTVYTAAFTGARDGSSISKSWTFTTVAN